MAQGSRWRHGFCTSKVTALTLGLQWKPCDLEQPVPVTAFVGLDVLPFAGFGEASCDLIGRL
jgi:hypothetical protein